MEIEELTKEEAKWLIAMLKAHINNLGNSTEACKDVSMSARIMNKCIKFTRT